jgi:acetolactate synthase-1/3 small subunit
MDVGHDTMSVELTGSPEKIEDFSALMAPYGIVEVARSGVVSMERSKKAAGAAGGAAGAGAARADASEAE